MAAFQAELDHGSGHAHQPADFGRAFLIGIMLNLGFVAIEATYGILANSVALLADVGHNLSDVLGLFAAWTAATLAKRAASATYTYGLRRATILAALLNAVLLLVAVGAIALEAISRLRAPEPVASGTVMAIAAIRHRRQWLHRLAVCPWSKGRHQHSWRFPAYDSRRGGFGRRGSRGARCRFDRPDVAGPRRASSSLS